MKKIRTIRTPHGFVSAEDLRLIIKVMRVAGMTIRQIGRILGFTQHEVVRIISVPQVAKLSPKKPAQHT